ncbi:MAG: murein biosynthesis integral membrane protein MurJ [Bacteriovoracaceae bacterium]|jgi:putative peptidoglycan lipid II flippase|nr:murein biosynthesis integral membrane protein MurJ [Bacteriovoracaceae bacterium]
MSKAKMILSSLKMAIATLISRVFGLIREQVMAFYFGASSLTDAFLVAYRIPNLLRDLFAEGAFSAAFVPSFIEVKNKSQEQARTFLWQLFIMLFVVTGLLSLLIYIFAPQLIGLFAPNFTGDPLKFEHTIFLTRIMSPFLLLVSLSALLMGVLNSLKVFFIPSLAPAFFNITMILSMIILPSYLAKYDIHIIYSLGFGVLFGGFVQGMIQVPLILKHGFSFTFPRKIITKESIKVFKKLGPGLLGFAATQINLLVTTILATSCAVGAVSWLGYGFRLFQLPVGILGVSIGNSNMVHFTDLWSSDKKNEAKEIFMSSIFLSLALMLPACIILLSFNEHIVRIVFERGSFDSLATKMTSTALFFYGIGLPFYGIYKILVPVFYTLDKQKVPVVVSIITIIVNIIFCMFLVPSYGFKILAIGTTISISLNCLIQFMILARLIDLRFEKNHLKAFSTYLISFVLLCYAAINMESFIHASTLLAMLANLFASMGLVYICFFVLLYALGQRQIVYRVKDKLLKKRTK